MRKINRSYQPAHFKVQIPRMEIQPGDIGRVQVYQVDEYNKLREEVNAEKSRMDALFGAAPDTQAGKDWSAIQSVVDNYKVLMYQLSDVYHAQHITNAWMKYYEMFHVFGVIPEVNTPPDHKYMAFFNAELPGAAVCAFNHFVKTLRASLDSDWRGASIVPNHESGQDTTTVLGDKYGLYSHNIDKWMMDLGADTQDGFTNNGDATIKANLIDYAARIGPASDIGGVDLYSHDAGIDVTGADTHGLLFNRQEQLNGKIHFGCALAGLMTLRIGGAFIAKQYTALETYSWNLIIIYASLFDKFYLSKPLTSRPYNSEMYLVGIGFRGLPDWMLPVMFGRLDGWDESPWLSWEDCKSKFAPALSEITRFQNAYCKRTISMIRENIALYNQWTGRIYVLRKELEGFRKQRAAEWIQQYPIVPLDPRDRLPSNG